MALTLYSHPLSSFCHKVIVALYENGAPFTAEIVNFGTPEADSFFAMWPMGKIPVLKDDAHNRVLPETTIMIEYLDQHYPGKTPLFPKDAAQCLEARLWDRIFDLFVHVSMQKIVADALRPEGAKDPSGVADARKTLRTAYDMIEKHMADRLWAIGDNFSVADCAASPALFYAAVPEPFADTHPNLSAYFERLIARPAFKRVLEEAKPFFKYYPLREQLPARFL